MESISGLLNLQKGKKGMRRNRCLQYESKGFHRTSRMQLNKAEMWYICRSVGGQRKEIYAHLKYCLHVWFYHIVSLWKKFSIFLDFICFNIYTGRFSGSHRSFLKLQRAVLDLSSTFSLHTPRVTYFRIGCLSLRRETMSQLARILDKMKAAGNAAAITEALK